MRKNMKIIKINSSKQRQNIKHKKNSIDKNKIINFLKLRIRLTKFNDNKLISQILVKWLENWIDNINIDNNIINFCDIDNQILQLFSNTVPWQFYYVINKNKIKINSFLLKELNNLPIEKKFIVIKNDDKYWIDNLSYQLSINFFIKVYENNLNKKITDKQIKELNDNLLINGLINWDNIKKIYKPIDNGLNSELKNNNKLNEIQNIETS